MTERSPWQLALGERYGDLHPRLVAYFAPIPAGFVGQGSGVFERAGSPHRWLRPLLALLADEGVLFPEWQRDVPFTVINRPSATGVRAERTFLFDGGARAMRDHVVFVRGSLVDLLGADRRGRSRIQAHLTADVVGGAVELRSSRVLVRLCGHHLELPAAIRPVVTLHEEWDDGIGAQRITLALDAPLFGRIYEYSGTFTYEVRPERPLTTENP